MKKAKRWIAALLAGELLVLRHKDKTFQKSLKKANGLDKLKVVFDGLFNFNKQVVEDIQHTNFEEMKKKAIAWFDQEKALLEEKLTTRESDFGNRSDEKLPIYLMWLENQFKAYEKKALARQDKLSKDYNLEKTIKMLKKRIDKANKALENTKANS